MNLKITIVLINEIKNHPNSNKHEIILINDIKCVVKKGQFKQGDKVVYLPIDSILTLELSKQLKITDKLNRNRIVEIQIEKETSEGVLMPIRLIPGIDFLPNKDIAIGTDITNLLCIKEYEK